MRNYTELPTKAPEIDQALKKALNALLSANSAKRPVPERNLDHVRATEETLVKRASLLQHFRQKAGGIIFLGDNDLSSIAFGLAAPDTRTTVVDIDPRILDFINDLGVQEGLKIDVFQHDFRQPLPKKLAEHDTVFCDPPYTPAGIRLWLKRAIEVTLKKGPPPKRKAVDNLALKDFLLCYGHADRAPIRGLHIQDVIGDLRLLIMGKLRAFNDYEGAKIIGSKSDLYMLKPTPQVALEKPTTFTTDLYTGQKNQDKA